MASRALATAATGGRALMDRVDTIANNLANVHTTAFKRVRANFADLLTQQVREGVTHGAGVRTVSTEKIFEQGGLARTGRFLDVAIEGEGFLRVRLPDGTAAFTRSGKLSVGAEGRLVANGYPLDPPVTVPGGMGRLVIDANGCIKGLDPKNSEAFLEVGRLTLTRFVNPSGLATRGDTLYLAAPGAGEPVTGKAASAGFGRILQGHLEESNVDVIRELVDLVAAQRAFEINGRTIEAVDKMLESINGTRR